MEAQAVVKVQFILLVQKKPPLLLSSHFFSSFPAKCFRTDGTTTFVFSDSLDSTC